MDGWGRTNNNVVNVYFLEDDTPLTSFHLQADEVEGIFALPVNELLRVHENARYTFSSKAINQLGDETEISVSKSSFPENFDNYHYKMALLAKRFFEGEKNLLY